MVHLKKGSEKVLKIKMGDNIFIQKKDFLRIVHQYEYPEVLVKPYLVNGVLSINRGIVNEMFLYAFSDKVSCEWIESQDWILDFDELNRLSIPDLRKMIKEERNNIAKRIGSEKYRDNERLLAEDNYKLSSLQDLLAYKENRKYFIFPEGYQLP
ncbi:hypothetical protein IJJ53_01110 [Candidatus Saccharibacteria bacterium]|nr:hypothetical protein [Candidatus Saccharibacteria bacterium]